MRWDVNDSSALPAMYQIQGEQSSKYNIHYKAMATMLKQNMQQIYIDEDWVVEQYTALEKTKNWDTLKVANDQLVGDLGAEIFAEESGVPVEALRLEDLEDNEAMLHQLR
jgi:hypothetical protein